MGSLFIKILITAFFAVLSFSVSATYVTPHQSWGFVKQEYDNFYLIYDTRSVRDFGTPGVSGDGSTIFFLPTDMSVEQRSNGRRYWRGAYPGWKNSERTDSYRGWRDRRLASRNAMDTWTTSIGIIPKEGFDASTFTLTEQGDYSFIPKSKDTDGSEGTFSITARMFLRGMDNPKEYEFLKLDESFTEDEHVRLEDWEISGTFDIGDFADGFWLTIQNTLKVEGSNRFHMDDKMAESNTYDKRYSHWKHKWKDKWKHHWFAREDELFLQKKYIGIELGGTEVPLPAAGWLFASAFALLAVVRRRTN